MNRYKKANEGIHAPDKLKKAVCRPRGAKRPLWAAAAAILVIAVIAGLVRSGGRPFTQPASASAFMIAGAVYPEMAPFPDKSQFTKLGGDLDWNAWNKAYTAWRNDILARQAGGTNADLSGFYTATIRQFLGSGSGENMVYAPLNVYMALAMLAELTDGASRQQILDLLGLGTIEEVRALSSALWNSNYRSDGAVTSILASSLWLNENIAFVQDTTDRLADTYYASSYQGQMGSDELNRAIQDWLNEQTGGLLKDAAGRAKLDPETVLALVSTIYFRASWTNEFQEAFTGSRTFHGASGDVTADFMNQSGSGLYCWGESFTATVKSFETGGGMWLILPAEGRSLNDLLAGDEVMDFLASASMWDNSKYLRVNLSMPKFDVSSQTDLIDGLKALGITDVFDESLSDFSPITPDVNGVYVSQITHAARVKVDEAGCEAAAFTLMTANATGGPPDDEVDFVLDRPFLFAVISETGQLLFIGTVNQP